MSTVAYIAHGGGPLPLLGDSGHIEMVRSLQELAAIIPEPQAIVMISAHWEASQPTITSGAKPELIYDYTGFPDATYQVQYPAHGEPAMAKSVHALIGKNDFNPVLDADRGFDHGMFVPLKIMYPQADIPCIQLSLLDSLDAAEHIKLGQSLSSLLEENILVIGSGLSFHNMRGFRSSADHSTDAQNTAFEIWLNDTCCNTSLSENSRAELLAHWEQAPGARFCHPREEHLLPLHVCYGIAQSAATRAFNITVMQRKASNFLWEHR